MLKNSLFFILAIIVIDVNAQQRIDYEPKSDKPRVRTTKYVHKPPPVPKNNDQVKKVPEKNLVNIVEAELRKADDYFDKGNYGEAASRYLQNESELDDEQQCRLGWMYYYGDGVSVNYSRAFSLFTLSAREKNSKALAFLGNMYRKGRPPVKPDFTQAISLFYQAIANGDDEGWGSYYLGVMHDLGLGLTINYDSARIYYLNSVAKANMHACYRMGVKNQYGHGIEKNIAKALEWFRRSAAGGDPFGFIGIGQLYQFEPQMPLNYDSAIYYFSKVLNRGDYEGEGSYNMGSMYEAGRGVTKNLQKAREMYTWSANLYNDRAMNAIGRMYENALGVPKDYAEALRWYKKSEALNNSGAMINIGNLYEYGLGTDTNYVEARRWYLKAAALKNGGAMFKIGLFYHNGYGVKVDYAEAMSWYRKAAALDDDYAMRNIGIMFMNGTGMPYSYAEALKWFQKSAALENNYSMYWIGSFYENGYAVSKNKTEALRWYEKSAKLGNTAAVEKVKQLKK